MTKEEMQKDIDFLLDRAKKAGICSFSESRDIGASSNDLITFVYTGELPQAWPWDESDYLACVRAHQSLPSHRKSKGSLDMLDEMKRRYQPEAGE